MTEIFIEPELENLDITENAEKWFEICSELGIKGQIKMADKSEEKKAPPYMYLDGKTERIIKILCSAGVKYKEYATSSIPLDVLEEIQKCEKNGWYENIYIFSDNKSPDPFVIGEYQSGDHSWQRSRHLIARWGQELLPWEQLEAKAINRMEEGIMLTLIEMKSKMEAAIANPKLLIKSLISGKNAPVLNINVPDLSNTYDLSF